MQMVPWTPLTPTEPLLRNAVAGRMMFSELGSNRQARFCWRSETQPMLYGARTWCTWHIIEVRDRQETSLAPYTQGQWCRRKPTGLP